MIYVKNSEIFKKNMKQAIEFVYFDADPIDQKIMEYMFGMGGVQRRTSKEIGQKLRLSPSTLKKRQVSIAKQIKELI